MISPEAQASIDANHRQMQDRWEGQRPLVAPNLGSGRFDLNQIDVGCQVYAHTDIDRYGDNARIRYDGEARGGIVVEVTHMPPDDEGTMERAFRVIDPQLLTIGGYELTLPESLVDRDRLMPFAPGPVRALVRAICRLIGDRKRGAFPHRYLTLLSDMARLGAVLGMKDAAR